MLDGIIGGIGILVSLVALYGLAAWVRPFWLVKHRWQGAAIVGVALVVASIIGVRPATRPDDITPAAWVQRVGVCRETEKDRSCPLSSASVIEAAAKVKAANAKALATASASADGAPTEVAADHAAQAASFLTTQTALSDAVRPCDRAMVKAARTRSVYDSYNAAMRAEAACKTTMMALGELKFAEPVSADARADLDPALDCFASAYGERREAMEKAAKLMDGDQRPSQISEFKGQLDDAIDRTNECVAQYLSAAVKHGFRGEVAKMSKD
jgi:hypothetical protein